MLSYSKGTETFQRNRSTLKKFKIPYFHFLQCALSDFFIFTSKFVFYLLTQFTMFSFSKGTNQINRCTLKYNIKSHIFILSVSPVRFLYLNIKAWVLPTNTLYNVFFFQRYLSKKKVHFHNKSKIPYFPFYSAPCQISLSLHKNLCFTYIKCLIFFPNVSIKDIGALSKIKLNHIFVFFTVRPVRFLYIYIKVCVLPLITQFTMFSSFKGT